MARFDPTFRWTSGLLLLVLVAASASCGAVESRSNAIEIAEASLRGDAVIVRGTWSKGLSTPPACQLLTGRDGKVIGRFSLEDAAFDANDFSQEISFEDIQAGNRSNYHVRCSVTLDSAKVASETVKVKG